MIMKAIAEGRDAGKSKKAMASDQMKAANALKDADSRASARLLLGLMVEMAYQNAKATPIELAAEAYEGCIEGQKELKQ
jgi:hypothetical protein